ncbi:ABC transporter ATP-binding protein [Moraxella oblonga]|uniref:ABC transporter ATP-binding protein n=1 Tax=Moraxella oblonga TaxID=200413 RepID=UPI0008362A80|nr:ABC transporter ATP-binding protein [Moraxella oblonga]
MTTLPTENLTNPHLTVDNLAVAFGNKTIFSDISFTLNQGDIGCLLGQSGCGKTAVLRSIMGFCQPNAGKIRLAQKELFNGTTRQAVAPHLRQVGMVFQDYALFSHLTVADNICFGIKHLAKSEQQARLDELLSLVGMGDFARRYPHELSGGQQQRVALARVFAMKPKLILLDEPFSNLDVELRASLSFEVRELLKSQNITAILVTHDQAEAFAMADKIGVMADGKLQQWDTPTRLYQFPNTKMVASFIGDGALIEIQNIQNGMATTAIGKIVCENTNDTNASTLLIRPENVHLDDMGVSAQVVFCGFKGGYFRCQLQTQAGELIAHLPITSGVKVGDEIKIKIVSGVVV